MSKGNICIIGLSKQFTDYVGKQLSIRMEMFYANVQEIIEFELMDINKMEAVCGTEYLQKEEKAIINRICSYDNTIVNIDFASLNDEDNLQTVKDNCLLIYIKLNEKRYLRELAKDNLNESIKMLSQEMMSDRDFLCSRMADITVDCQDYQDTQLIDNIIESILKFYS